MFRKFGFALSILSMGIFVLPISAQTPISPPQELSLDEQIRRVDTVFDGIERARETIDISPYDFERFTGDMMLATTPGEILDWVRTNIAFEAYPGVLRGAQGTFRARAGNALDQAVLLAGLIKDAGFEARIARGRLTQEQAASLLAQMAYVTPHVPDASLVGYKQELRATMEEVATSPEDAQAFAEAIDAMPDELNSDDLTIPPEVNELADALLAAIEGHTNFDPEALLAEYVAEAQDYFWVEYRTFAAEPWTAAHPAFKSGATPPGELAATEYLTDTVPEELQHRVRIEVVIESRIGDKISEVPVIPAFERPAANLAGVPISYKNVPDGLTLPSLEAAGSFSSALDTTRFFIPVFDGQVVSGTEFFGLNGLTAPSEIAGSPFAAVFEEVSSKALKAAEAISSLGDKAGEETQPLAELVSQTMRVTLIAPGGKERAIERSIWRTPSETPRDDTAAREALATQMTMMVSVGRETDLGSLDPLLAWIASLRGPLKGVLKGSQAVTSEERREATEGVEDPLDSAAHLLAFTAFDAGAAKFADRSYRSAPTVAIIRSPLVTTDETKLTFDVLANERRVSRLDGDGEPVPAPDSGVKIGVWESVAEQAALFGGVTSTEIIKNAVDEGIPLRVMSRDDTSAINAIQFVGDMREYVMADLDDGYIVVVPERAPQSIGRSAWWRVDPNSGNTIGFLDSGIGGDYVEYGIVSALFGGGTYFACLFGMTADRTAATPDEHVKCALIGAGVGVGIFLAAPALKAKMLEVLISEALAEGVSKFIPAVLAIAGLTYEKWNPREK